MHIFGLYGDGGVVVQIKIASKVRGKKNYANGVIVVVVVGGGGCCCCCWKLKKSFICWTNGQFKYSPYGLRSFIKF